MIILKKIELIITVILITTLIGNTQNNIYITSNASTASPVNVDVLLFSFDDPYMSSVRQSLENIQKENKDKVNFAFYNGKGNQNIQNETIENLINGGNTNLLLVNLVDTRADVIENVINKAKQKNIPLILFNTEPEKTDVIKSYPKAIMVSTDAKKSGILEGNILVDLWNKNKEVIDKNKDNIMQYIMLEGQSGTTSAIARTKYSVSTINQAGIKTQELASRVANWNQELAKSAFEPLFLKYYNNIEAIIANNDAMAIGAIEVLQKYGYNKGDEAKTIPVVGIDGIPPALDLIKKGFMAGTVIQNSDDMAKALYTIGMNLINNRDPLEGTDYKFDETGVIRTSYSEYMH